MSFWKFIVNKTEGKPDEIELRIEGDIVDDGDAWIYEWLGETVTTTNNFKEQLKAHAGKDLTVWIDSYGGNVFAAAGIYNALKEHKGKITVKIDGKAMSAASVIAMAGDEILMSPLAIMMVHNPLSGAYGYASELRQTADALDVIKEALMNSYQLKTGKKREEISALMDNETYMSATTAIKEKFADGMLYGDIADVQNSIAFSRSGILNSTNEAIKRIVAKEKPDPQIEVLKAKLALQISL
jgi:ATP-dependent Clp protease protease subunit